MTEKGFGYLDKNLRPWIEKVSPVTDQSDISGFLGGDPLFVSQHSCRIRVGNNIERFWNEVISSITTNLIEDSWSGIVSRSRNSSQIFEMIEKNIYVAGCYNGSGIGVGTLFGEQIAIMASDQQSNEIEIINKRVKPNWLPPSPILNLGVQTRLFFERLRAKSEI